MIVCCYLKDGLQTLENSVCRMWKQQISVRIPDKHQQYTSYCHDCLKPNEQGPFRPWKAPVVVKNIPFVTHARTRQEPPSLSDVT